MKQKESFIVTYCIILIGLSSACFVIRPSPAEPTLPPLTPWIRVIPTTTPTSTFVFPTATSQPPPVQTYIVKEGDTLSEIAFRHNLTVEDLLLANEGLDPRIISKGATLIIPQKKQGKIILPTPTAIPILISPPQCYDVLPSGLYCIALVQNTSPDPVDDISATIKLFQLDGQPIAEQQVALPLTRLAAGKSLPLLAGFPQVQGANLVASVQLLSALPAHNGDGRFLPLTIHTENTTMLNNNKAAIVNGLITVEIANANSALYLRLAAVAYNHAQNPIGLRTWDWQGIINPTQEIPFEITLFSLSDAIDAVDLQAEAVPQ